MIDLIESKIAQLKDEVNKATNFIAQLMHTVSKSQEQIKGHETNVTKLSGAIEAFQATLGAMKSSGNPVQDVVSAVEKTAENAIINEIEQKVTNVENSGI